MNFETLARIKRIEIALDSLKAAVATLESQVVELKKPKEQEKRPVLTLKKNV